MPGPRGCHLLAKGAGIPPFDEKIVERLWILVIHRRVGRLGIQI